MPVLTRLIRSVSLNGISFVGAVAEDGGVTAWGKAGQSIAAMRAAFGPALLSLDGTRHALRARLAPGALDAPQAEPAYFAGKNVLVAIRHAETAEATGDWLAYHIAEQGADAALIFDRAPPGSQFAPELQADCPVLIVNADTPAGPPDSPDLRDPATAPAAPKRATPLCDPWFAHFIEHGLIDLIRAAYLTQARAVALVNISDLILPAPEGTVFDRAAATPGTVLPLRGIETYPWRLRQNRPAPHSDHIASRRSERRVPISWALAPNDDSPKAFWRPVQPYGVPVAEAAPHPFARAMGVVYPGVPVNRLTRKPDLREQPALVTQMARAFDAEPLRLPSPVAIPPRPKFGRTTIVTAMKNEGPFILDWIAHNRAIGVDDILVYTNDCDDGSDRLLSLLAEAGVTHRDNPYRAIGKVPQHAAFRAAEDEPVVQEADWLLTLDVDEYLNIHTGDRTLAALRDAVPDAHAVSIPWRMFGNADRHGFDDIPVTEQFTRCAPEYAPRPLQAWAFKTLYRNEGLFRRLGVHRPKGMARDFRDTLNWVDAIGRPLPPAIRDKAWRMSKGQWGYSLATLNHYAVRSAESFLVKRDRGKVNRTRRDQGLAYWFRMNHNAEEDRTVQALADRVAAEKSALMALPGVRAAHEEAVGWHRSRIATLLSDPDYAEFFARITSPRMEHLSRIATYFGANVHLAGPEVIPDDIAATEAGKPFYWTVKLVPEP